MVSQEGDYCIGISCFMQVIIYTGHPPFLYPLRLAFMVFIYDKGGGMSGNEAT